MLPLRLQRPKGSLNGLYWVVAGALVGVLAVMTTDFSFPLSVLLRVVAIAVALYGLLRLRGYAFFQWD